MRRGANLTYYHYTVDPTLTQIRSRRQEHPWRKPHGFWISDDRYYSWRDFCNDHWPSNAVEKRYKITLKQTAKVKIISNEKQLRKFSNDYCSPPDWDFLRRHTINWKKVAKKYQGIIITPYLWNWGLMQECAWYYGWDCASGCIWDKEAIESIEIVQH